MSDRSGPAEHAASTTDPATVEPSGAGTTTRTLVTRWDLTTGQAFDAFTARFEAAVPPLDFERLRQLVERHAHWSDVEQAVTDNAPHGFVVFARLDSQLLMSLAGHRRRAVQYLVGNHLIAERMYRYDPDALLYAPLRFLVYDEHDDGTGQAVIALDRPSTVFAGLARPEVVAVGHELDRKVSQLLSTLDVSVPAL